MRHQEASRVVHVTVPEAMARLRAVEEWPRFLHNLDSVTPAGPGRYVFRLVDQRAARDVSVVVSTDVKQHIIRWKALRGPAFFGSIRLVGKDTEYTVAKVEMTSHPATLSAALNDMVLASRQREDVDVEGLDRFLTGRGADEPGAAPAPVSSAQ